MVTPNGIQKSVQSAESVNKAIRGDQLSTVHLPGGGV